MPSFKKATPAQLSGADDDDLPSFLKERLNRHAESAAPPPGRAETDLEERQEDESVA